MKLTNVKRTESSKLLAMLCLFAIAIFVSQSGCSLAARIIFHNGELQLKPAPPAPSPPGPHVIIFALDGAAHDLLMQAIRSGKAPNIASLLGKEQAPDLFEHAYSAPDAVSMMPSSTIADWTAIFTGEPPARDGIAGDEWFNRERERFFAPVPVSIDGSGDLSQALDNDLIGKQIRVPTLYERVRGRSYVSLLSIYRGATIFSTVEPSAVPDLIAVLFKGELAGELPFKSLSGDIDLDSVPKLTQAINEHGVPELQVVYFPGIDSFTHATKHNPLQAQVSYLETVTDKGVGQVLDLYRSKGLLDSTYVIFIADHGHTPVVYDHNLGTTGNDTPFALLADRGFRVRKPKLNLAPADHDFNAVVAYQGFDAYIYLADRSLCPNPGDRCDWMQPPRFRYDVMPVVRAFYRDNRIGRPVPRLRHTIDLIFAREPVPPGEPTHPFEIYDGHRLVPIPRYLARHHRSDLVDLDQRMRWLGEGPEGGNAGDIILLSRASADIPIQDRYYFSSPTHRHYTYHGSANTLDSYIPFILAKSSASGDELRRKFQSVTGEPSYELEMTPLVLSILGSSAPQAQPSPPAIMPKSK